jgi:hypothetical protein
VNSALLKAKDLQKKFTFFEKSACIFQKICYNHRCVQR